MNTYARNICSAISLTLILSSSVQCIEYEPTMVQRVLSALTNQDVLIRATDAGNGIMSTNLAEYLVGGLGGLVLCLVALQRIKDDEEVEYVINDVAVDKFEYKDREIKTIKQVIKKVRGPLEIKEREVIKKKKKRNRRSMRPNSMFVSFLPFKDIRSELEALEGCMLNLKDTEDEPEGIVEILATMVRSLRKRFNPAASDQDMGWAWTRLLKLESGLGLQYDLKLQQYVETQ